MATIATLAIDLGPIAGHLQIPLGRVERVVELLDAGNTVPFITRYRKDETGGLDEEQIREIQQRLGKLRLLGERKQTILRSIESQGKLTEALAAEIEAAQSTKRLEDLYLPFKPKKQTLATVARERGLEPLAEEVLGAVPRGARFGSAGRRFRQHRSRRHQRRRCLAGRRAHPGRSVQRAGRSPAAAAQDRRPHRQADRRPGRARRQESPGLPRLLRIHRAVGPRAAAPCAGHQPGRKSQGAARQGRGRPRSHAADGRRAARAGRTSARRLSPRLRSRCPGAAGVSQPGAAKSAAK